MFILQNGLLLYPDSGTFVLIGITDGFQVPLCVTWKISQPEVHLSITVDVAVSVHREASLLERGNAPHERPSGCVPIWPWGEWGLDGGMEEGKNEKTRG